MKTKSLLFAVLAWVALKPARKMFTELPSMKSATRGEAPVSNKSVYQAAISSWIGVLYCNCVPSAFITQQSVLSGEPNERETLL